jgi:two-component system, OmpR family, sensor histidine kinase KdpD
MTEEYKRPDPDELLKKIKEEENWKKRKNGLLTVFLGYVAGVGKTYRMLSDAIVLKEKKIDIIAGLVETHGRAETETLLGNIRVLPRKKIDYKGITLEEFDIDAALEIKPDYILVDELAHTNAPGSRHKKRYQDVEELLEAGINVFTTMNIQHIASLNDIISQITEIDVKETVPDRIIENSDEIELIDLPKEELIQRLEEGKVYIPEKAKRAMKKFFKDRNLVALRELALRYTTTWVDHEMKYHLKKDEILGPWDASSRIMVAINEKYSSEKLIRLTHRFSDNLNV